MSLGWIAQKKEKAFKGAKGKKRFVSFLKDSQLRLSLFLATGRKVSKGSQFTNEIDDY